MISSKGHKFHTLISSGVSKLPWTENRMREREREWGTGNRITGRWAINVNHQWYGKRPRRHPVIKKRRRIFLCIVSFFSRESFRFTFHWQSRVRVVKPLPVKKSSSSVIPSLVNLLLMGWRDRGEASQVSISPQRVSYPRGVALWPNRIIVGQHQLRQQLFCTRYSSDVQVVGLRLEGGTGGFNDQ